MTILIIIAIIIIGLLIYLSTINPKYEVKASQAIHVTPSVAFDYILDFKTWPEWSPWIMHEKDVKLEYHGPAKEEGSGYSWKGQRIGEGKMTLKKVAPHEKIEQYLEFLKPFKSQADVFWLFEKEGSKTKVTWGMEGKMPFFFKMMIPMMKKMITIDYKIGLTQINQNLDSKAPKMHIEFVGEENFQAGTVIYKNFKGDLEGMKKAMGEGYPFLYSFCQEHNLKITDPPLAIYNKVKPDKYFDVDIAVPIEESSGSVGGGDVKTRKLSQTKYFRVDLKGSYDFLEYAWYSAMAHLRMRKLKYNRAKPSLEIYQNDPQNTAPDNLHTSIYVAIK